MRDNFVTLYGDIHNHNALGYGIGSLERAIDIARTHLDFFAFTGHASWHDLEPMEGGRERHWTDGFARLREGWPKVQRLIADANRNDEFTAFLGYEWHSSRFGDQCVVFPADHRPLMLPDNVGELRQFCLSENALMIPHHLAYPTGRRGVNWEVFDPACTPVVEIFSEHGNSEDDRGPYPFFNHSMGGRKTSNTVRAALIRGMRFGFVASSDSHSGFPGAYGEGLLAVHSRGQDRASIMEAIRARRTFALTGDRIALEMQVNGAPMGADVRAGHSVAVDYAVEGRDELDVIELIQDGAIVHRDFPRLQTALAEGIGAPFQLRFEWGWGPWGDLSLSRTTDWEFSIEVEQGELHRVFPCLQSGPFDEARRHHFRRSGDNSIDVSSYTSRAGAYRQNPNQSVVIELSGQANTMVTVVFNRPVPHTIRTSVADLFADSFNGFVGPFPKEGYQWHRLVPRTASALDGHATLAVPDGPGWIYLRVRQANGQMAWASPVFINYAGSP
ncbi:MAG: hypothetical protein P8Y71_03185 [Pseudolabrys sp.]